jgi:hypothetical protein
MLTTKYQPQRFCQFENAYKRGLLAAVKAKPGDYWLKDGETPESYAERVSDKMLFTVATEGISKVNAIGGGWGRACRELGIKNTYSAMHAYLLGVQS